VDVHLSVASFSVARWFVSVRACLLSVHFWFFLRRPPPSRFCGVAASVYAPLVFLFLCRSALVWPLLFLSRLTRFLLVRPPLVPWPPLFCCWGLGWYQSVLGPHQCSITFPRRPPSCLAEFPPSPPHTTPPLPIFSFSTEPTRTLTLSQRFSLPMYFPAFFGAVPVSKIYLMSPACAFFSFDVASLAGVLLTLPPIFLYFSERRPSPPDSGQTHRVFVPSPGILLCFVDDSVLSPRPVFAEVFF